MSESINTNKFLTEDSALVIWDKVKEEIGKIVIPEGGLTSGLVNALIDAKINPLISNDTPEIDTINEIKAFLSSMEGKTLQGIIEAIEAKIITEEERNNLKKVTTLTDYAINNYQGVVYNIQDPTAGVVGTTEGILLPIERAKIGLDGNVLASADNRLIKLATSSLHGVMSKLDKLKLDTLKTVFDATKSFIPDNFEATQYSDNVHFELTGKVFNDEGNYDSDGVQVTINAATSTSAGVMSTADKKLIDSLPDKIITSPLYYNDNAGDGIDIAWDIYRKTPEDGYVKDDSYQEILNINIVDPTGNNDGLMSCADKKLLDGLAAYNSTSNLMYNDIEATQDGLKIILLNDVFKKGDDLNDWSTQEKLIDFTIPYATSTSAGAMSLKDKKWLDAAKNLLKYPTSQWMTDSFRPSTNSFDIALSIDKLDDEFDNVNDEISLTIPAATTTAAGAMSADDKKLVDSLPTNILSDLNINELGSDYIELILDQTHKNNLGVYTTLEVTLSIPAADPHNAGLMSTTDKERLDNVPIEMQTPEYVLGKAFVEGELSLSTDNNGAVLYLPITKSGYYTINGTPIQEVLPNIFTLAVWNTVQEFNLFFTLGIPVNPDFWSESKKGKTWWGLLENKAITVYLTSGLVIMLSGLQGTQYSIRYLNFPGSIAPNDKQNLNKIAGLRNITLMSLPLPTINKGMESIAGNASDELKAEILAGGKHLYYIHLESDNYNDLLLLSLDYLNWSTSGWSLYFKPLEFHVNGDIVKLTPRIDYVQETSELNIVLSNTSN